MSTKSTPVVGIELTELYERATSREDRRQRDESIVTIFRASDNPPPPEIKGLSGNMDE